jgi:hypothetical protein
VTLTAPDRLHIPLVGHDILRGLYTHRLLTTTQVHELYAPDHSLRWALLSLTRLEDDGLIARVRVAGSRQHAWYLRPAGVALTEGPGVEVRRYRMDARRAVAPQQAHTLATNEVGLCFVRAARAHGDDCWSEAWRNEAAHRIGQGGRGEVVISDAVLDYTVVEAGVSTYLCRFVEVDRATKKLEVFIRQLEAYARLYACRPAWRAYPIFPPVVVVMTGPPEKVLLRRIDALDRLLPLSAPLANASEVVIFATTLEQLRTHGPHAPIFWQSGQDPHDKHLVDIRGRRSVRPVVTPSQ